MAAFELSRMIPTIWPESNWAYATEAQERTSAVRSKRTRMNHLRNEQLGRSCLHLLTHFVSGGTLHFRAGDHAWGSTRNPSSVDSRRVAARTACAIAGTRLRVIRNAGPATLTAAVTS